MSAITLSTHTEDGTPLEATFLPEIGMNLISYKLGDIEVIDQSTKKDFEETRGGLGPLIGPHFHVRPAHLIQKIDYEFSHIKHMNARKKKDPFSHGVARYAPWRAETKEDSIHAELCGEDTLDGIPLSEIEGQNFKMRFDAHLTANGLKLDLSVISDTDSITGIHYYYALPNGKGEIHSQVQNAYIVNNEKKPLPKEWNINPQHMLTYPLSEETDFTFFPYPDPLNGEIILETETHQLITRSRCQSAENSWQLWHPKGASFVCIEPVSSQDPRHPNLTVSTIGIDLEIKKNPYFSE